MEMPDCTSKEIWESLEVDEQGLWVILYNAFLNELGRFAELGGSCDLSDGDVRDAVAHNLAYEVFFHTCDRFKVVEESNGVRLVEVYNYGDD